MATITGSGKYVQISGGALKLGSDSTLYANIYSDSLVYSGRTYQGITFDSVGYLNLTQLQSLTIGNTEAFTGVISMCTGFNYPFPILIWDEDEYDTIVARTTMTFKKYRFVNGIMVGEVT